MDDALKIYWEVFAEKMSTDKIIRQTPNPLREYEEDFIEGAIVDIGCGQSNFLLEYAQMGRKLYAIDSDKSQLDALRNRALGISANELKNWQFLNLSFPDDKLPEDSYAVIILSNLLHFFNLEECRKIEAAIREISRKGTLIYIVVHSHRYYSNNPSNPDNFEYFKHYFTKQELIDLFPLINYEAVFQAEIEKLNSSTEEEVISEWLDRYLELEEVPPGPERELEKLAYMQNNRVDDIQMIFRRR